MDTARCVRLRYVGTDDQTIRDALSEPSYVQYLRRSKAGPVTPGTAWTESVNDGCGQIRHVTLIVDAVVGGDAIGEATTFEFRSAP